MMPVSSSRAVRTWSARAGSARSAVLREFPGEPVTGKNYGKATGRHGDQEPRRHWIHQVP